ncbi:hypothetical protein R3P38DRAFT_2768061 [Favolaschia claudopus]|uniref:Uncharacterized protein n=1 Tax=Favolaschia claudopus TaxID=2862362 RepID=A0AAW0CU29_9AGAR
MRPTATSCLSVSSMTPSLTDYSPRTNHSAWSPFRRKIRATLEPPIHLHSLINYTGPGVSGSSRKRTKCRARPAAKSDREAVDNGPRNAPPTGSEAATSKATIEPGIAAFKTMVSRTMLILGISQKCQEVQAISRGRTIHKFYSFDQQRSPAKAGSMRAIQDTVWASPLFIFGRTGIAVTEQSLSGREYFAYKFNWAGCSRTKSGGWFTRLKLSSIIGRGPRVGEFWRYLETASVGRRRLPRHAPRPPAVPRRGREGSYWEKQPGPAMV